MRSEQVGSIEGAAKVVLRLKWLQPERDDDPRVGETAHLDELLGVKVNRALPTSGADGNRTPPALMTATSMPMRAVGRLLHDVGQHGVAREPHAGFAIAVTSNPVTCRWSAAPTVVRAAATARTVTAERCAVARAGR